MNSEAILSTADIEDVRWFAGYGPASMSGREYTHDCEHRDLTTIAWGPSFLHYELVRCIHCECRSWFAALPGSNGGIWDSHAWLEPLGVGDET